MATSQHLEVARVSGVHSSSFLCQKCCQPLKLDTSFYAVDQRLFNELTGRPIFGHIRTPKSKTMRAGRLGLG